MMEFEKFTADVVTQTVYLDRVGGLQHSCDTLFSTAGWQKDSIFNHFPLLKSIFAKLSTLQLHQQPIYIPKVESATGLPPGFYDFSFVCVSVRDEQLIRWVIYDLTQKYSDLQQEQQSQHNRFIARDNKIYD